MYTYLGLKLHKTNTSHTVCQLLNVDLPQTGNPNTPLVADTNNHQNEQRKYTWEKMWRWMEMGGCTIIMVLKIKQHRTSIKSFRNRWLLTCNNVFECISLLNFRVVFAKKKRKTLKKEGSLTFGMHRRCSGSSSETGKFGMAGKKAVADPPPPQGSWAGVGLDAGSNWLPKIETAKSSKKCQLCKQKSLPNFFYPKFALANPFSAHFRPFSTHFVAIDL